MKNLYKDYIKSFTAFIRDMVVDTNIVKNKNIKPTNIYNFHDVVYNYRVVIL